MLGGRVVREIAATIDDDYVYLYQSTAATLDKLMAFDLHGEANHEAVTNADNGDHVVPSSHLPGRISAVAWLWLRLANGTQVKLLPVVECDSGTKLLAFVRMALPRSLFPYKMTDVFVWSSQSNLFVDVSLNAAVEDLAIYQFHLVEKVPLPNDRSFQSPFRSPFQNGLQETPLASDPMETTVPMENTNAQMAPGEQGAAVVQKQHSTKTSIKTNINPPVSAGSGSVSQALLYQQMHAASHQGCLLRNVPSTSTSPPLVFAALRHSNDAS